MIYFYYTKLVNEWWIFSEKSTQCCLKLVWCFFKSRCHTMFFKSRGLKSDEFWLRKNIKNQNNSQYISCSVRKVEHTQRRTCEFSVHFFRHQNQLASCEANCNDKWSNIKHTQIKKRNNDNKYSKSSFW